MSNQHKISAFTLNEMVVVLILSSIVVGLAFTSLRLIQKQMLSIQTNYKHTMTLNKLETALWIDFNRYSKIRYNALERELILSNAIASTSYTFTDNYVVSPKDTFNIKLLNTKFYSNGKLSDDYDKIDAVAIETSKDYGSHKLFIFKQNAATAFMN